MLEYEWGKASVVGIVIVDQGCEFAVDVDQGPQQKLVLGRVFFRFLILQYGAQSVEAEIAVGIAPSWVSGGSAFRAVTLGDGTRVFTRFNLATGREWVLEEIPPTATSIANSTWLGFSSQVAAALSNGSPVVESPWSQLSSRPYLPHYYRPYNIAQCSQKAYERQYFPGICIDP